MELNPIGFCHFDIKKTIQLLMATSRSERICWEKKISAAFFNKVFLQKNFQVIKIFMKSMMQPEHLVQDYSLHSTKLFNNMFYCNL